MVRAEQTARAPSPGLMPMVPPSPVGKAKEDSGIQDLLKEKEEAKVCVVCI